MFGGSEKQPLQTATNYPSILQKRLKRVHGFACEHLQLMKKIWFTTGINWQVSVLHYQRKSQPWPLRSDTKTLTKTLSNTTSKKKINPQMNLFSDSDVCASFPFWTRVIQSIIGQRKLLFPSVVFCLHVLVSIESTGPWLRAGICSMFVHWVVLNMYTYHRSGNFRVVKFLCFNLSCKNIFVVYDTHKKFLTVCSQV